MRDKQAQMALARQRLLTLAYGDMETIRMVRQARRSPQFVLISLRSSCRIVLVYVPPRHSSHCILSQSPQELEAVARDWTKPPPDAVFSLRVPVEYASLQAAVSSCCNSYIPVLISTIQRLVAGPYIYVSVPHRRFLFPH